MWIDKQDVMDRARGRWKELFVSFRIDERFLTGKHGPCPFCGGKDRFIYKNKNGDGTCYCNQCDAKGNGLTILKKHLGLDSPKDFPELLERINGALGFNTHPTKHEIKEGARKDEFVKNLCEKIWLASSPLYQNMGSAYLEKRGIRGLNYAALSNVRFNKSLGYYENGKTIDHFPAIVGKVTDGENRFLGIHRTYLSPSHMKAPVNNPKMLLGRCRGGSIKIGQHESEIHLTEGLETGLAVHQYHGGPVWVAISATNLELIEIPKNIKTVTVWADQDRNRTGEKSAVKLAERLIGQQVDVDIKIPNRSLLVNRKSIDWLDLINKTVAEEGQNA